MSDNKMAYDNNDEHVIIPDGAPDEPLRKPHHRSQRLLVRVPSTGAVVVVESAMLFFGKHKQRGKPLTLCPAFDCADPSAAVCPDAANCHCVHADVRHAPLFQPHLLQAACSGEYPRLPIEDGPLLVAPAGGDSDVEYVPPGSVLVTRAQEMVRRPLRHCAHFLSGKCNRGSECEFVHAVLPPVSMPTPIFVPTMLSYVAPPPWLMANPVAALPQRAPPSFATGGPVKPGHHAMPSCSAGSRGSRVVASAAAVVSPWWQPSAVAYSSCM